MKVPSLAYPEVVSAFQRAGWVVVRQRGSHIRMQRRTETGLRKITVVAHRPIKRSTLAKLLKSAEVPLEEFLTLLR
ncbi:MAG: type II toxin-antitoxin system HicA family toxin [Acidobacteriota bacterium]|nr:type II toxin-antitoxin system HicA family toxin [Acidobacteriota bacterium]